MSRKHRDPRDPSRRRFLAGVAAAGSSLILPGCGDDDPQAAPLPNPQDSGIDYIVQVMMENRSFDHFLGWVPGADGRQGGQSFPNAYGQNVETFNLAADPAYGWQGCGWADPNHGYDAGRVHLNGGRMNGFLLTGGTADNPEDKFPVGYYGEADLPFYAGVARNFTVCDRYHHGILAQTFPNRIYIHAGATDRLTNTLPWAQQDPSVLPTIWDALAEAGISTANYHWDLPTPGLWGAKYADLIRPFPQFLLDCAAGTLPNVSYIDPMFGASVGEGIGIARDDHPVADVRDGQAFLAQIYNALRTSPVWDRTLMIVTYDEWGGFFDHVVPDFAPISDEERALGNDGRLGFRTPCVLLGPRVKRGHVCKLPFDPSSVLNLISWRFGVRGIGARAATSLNMAHALDFQNAPNLEAPDFEVPQMLEGVGAFGQPCLADLPIAGAPLSAAQKSRIEHVREWEPLVQMCRKYGLIK